MSTGLRFHLVNSSDKEKLRAQVKERFQSGEFYLEIDFMDASKGTFLESMRRIMIMKESADKRGMGFAVFFEGPSGKQYLISNLYD